MTILLTGSTGMVGTELLKQIDTNANKIRLLTRKNQSKPRYENCVADISIEQDFSQALKDISTIIHCAGRSHAVGDNSCALDECRAINTAGTLRLAKQGAALGVKRFIFISTVKVFGEVTKISPFSESSIKEPSDAYGVSKLEAENGLRRISQNTKMEVVIISPPLVYGGNVKANFLNLIKLADSFIPLPFSNVQNKRSMIYVGNLVDFIIKCLDHPAAANQTFIVSDGIDVSLTYLLKSIRSALGKPLLLFSVPKQLFYLTGALTGKIETIDRLLGDLQVDSSKACDLLDWKPPFTVDEGIKATVTAYLDGKKQDDSNI